jgi:carboxyl-terminal processing protease
LAYFAKYMNTLRKIIVTGLVAVLFVVIAAGSYGNEDSARKVDRKRNRLIGYILSRQLPTFHFSDKVIDDDLAKAAFHLYIKQLDYQKRFLLQKDVDQLRAFAPYIDDNLVSGQISLPDTGYDILTEKIDLVQKMVEEMLAANEVLTATAGSEGTERQISEYVVQPGDTLSTIAERYPQDTLADISSRNKLLDSARIYVGQKLMVRERVAPPGEGEITQVGFFDIRRREAYETDPEKLDFVIDIPALQDRWRKILKAELISQYLDLEEDRQKQTKTAADKEGKRDLVGKSDKELWQEAITKISKRNKTFFQRLHKETLQDHYDRFFNCIARAFDPHTNYIPPADKEQFDISMRGSLEGIGALLREDDGLIKVIRIIPGSASALQGRLKAEDTILQVAQEGQEPVDITDMRLRDAVRLIRGPKGEAVTLTVKKPDGTTELIRIVRDVVQIEETFVKSTTFPNGRGGTTGYVFIPSFYRDFEGGRNGNDSRNSTDDTLKEVEKLKKMGVDGLVLDLRDDGGGALVDAVDITGLFIDSGPVVQVMNSFGEKRVLQDTEKGLVYDGPMVVLVNKFSASASEIVAAALQDYRRAVIIGGKHTHGKGTVQTILDLNENIPLLHLSKYEDLGALKVTIQKFYRVTGSSTQYTGVEPDIVLPNLFEHLKTGERYLDYSLPSDSIDPVPYTPWRQKPIPLAELRKRSEQRTETDPGLKIIAQEAKKAEARAEQTMVSLTIDDMRAKRLEAQEVREKIGAHYRRFREEQDSVDDYGDSGDAAEEPREVWLKNVQEDPYIREAVNVVGDVIELSAK